MSNLEVLDLATAAGKNLLKHLRQLRRIPHAANNIQRAKGRKERQAQGQVYFRIKKKSTKWLVDTAKRKEGKEKKTKSPGLEKYVFPGESKESAT